MAQETVWIFVRDSLAGRLNIGKRVEPPVRCYCLSESVRTICIDPIRDYRFSNRVWQPGTSLCVPKEDIAPLQDPDKKSEDELEKLPSPEVVTA